jgi:hypothetical protein
VVVETVICRGGSTLSFALPVQLPALFGQDVLAGSDGLVWFADFPALLLVPAVFFTAWRRV